MGYEKIKKIDTYETPSGHLQDTFQTPSRHLPDTNLFTFLEANPLEPIFKVEQNICGPKQLCV